MSKLARDANGQVIQAIRPGTVQTVTTGAASAATPNKMGDDTQIARIVCTKNCHYVVGPAPVATANDTFLPAGMVEFIAIQKNDKIAFIQDSEAGIAYVTEAY